MGRSPGAAHGHGRRQLVVVGCTCEPGSRSTSSPRAHAADWMGSDEAPPFSRGRGGTFKMMKSASHRMDEQDSFAEVENP